MRPLKAEGEKEEPTPEWNDFVVSRAGTQKRRTLHQVGRCFRIPTVHYRLFRNYGIDMPPNSAYDWVCLGCWPQKEEEVESGGESAEESSSYSDEDDSKPSQASK